MRVHGSSVVFVVIIVDYDGRRDPTSNKHDGFYVWAQIHKVPDLNRHYVVVDQLAWRIGKVKKIQLRPRLLYGTRLCAGKGSTSRLQATDSFHFVDCRRGRPMFSAS